MKRKGVAWFLAIILLLLGMGAGTAEEVVLRTDYAPYVVYYGSQGKPEEIGQENVTLMEYHSPYAMDDEGKFVELTETELQELCGQFGEISVYDYWQQKYINYVSTMDIE